MNLDDTRVDRTRLYETRPGTWIAGGVAGVLLSLGLVMAGDRYVRVAKGAADAEAKAIAQRTQHRRVASTHDRGCDLASAVCNRKCVAC